MDIRQDCISIDNAIELVEQQANFIAMFLINKI